jgi:polysaccharide pyruvyl transferase WcaK-like protein
MKTNRPSVVVLGDTRGLYHHGCEAVLTGLGDGLASVGLPIEQTIQELDWSRERDLCLNAGLLVVNGEGSLHHDRESVEQVLSLGEARASLGRKTVLVNTSWFANSPDRTARLAAFSLVAARDSRSASEMATSGAQTIWAPDLAIRTAQAFASPTPSHGLGVLVGDSTRTGLTAQLGDLAKRRGWPRISILKPAIEIKPGAKAAKIRRRYRWARALGALGRVLVSERYRSHLDGLPDIESYAKVLSAHGGVVTGRFHTVCFCVGLGIPFLAIASNTPKIQDLVRDAGLDLERRIIEPGQLAEVQSVADFSPAERIALETFMTQAETRYQTLFARIAEVAADT